VTHTPTPTTTTPTTIRYGPVPLEPPAVADFRLLGEPVGTEGRIG
jgi:hypothetical protein